VVVLSFVIFIAFLFFIFTVLQPKLNLSGKDKQSIVDYLRVELLNNFTSNLTTIFINVSRSHITGQSCLTLFNFMINASPISPRLFVQNGSNANLSSVVAGSDLEIKIENSDNPLFKVYESLLFADITGTGFSNCKKLYLNADYSLTLKKTDLYVFESIINSTIQNYKSNYPSLKTAFNIPPDSEFGLIFKNAEGIINQPSFNITQSSNVYTDDIPILYVGKEGYIKSGSLEILVW